MEACRGFEKISPAELSSDSSSKTFLHYRGKLLFFLILHIWLACRAETGAWWANLSQISSRMSGQRHSWRHQVKWNSSLCFPLSVHYSAIVNAPQVFRKLLLETACSGSWHVKNRIIGLLGRFRNTGIRNADTDSVSSGGVMVQCVFRWDWRETTHSAQTGTATLG